MSYKANGVERLNIKEGSFVFETSKDKILIDICVDCYGEERHARLVESTVQNYEFKKYIEQIPNGPSALGLTFEFLKHPEAEYDPKLMGI